MKVLAIPGKVPATHAWIEDVVKAIGLKSVQLHTHQFQAWNSDQPFDLNRELLVMPQGEYDLIVAKSIGTLATLRVLSQLKSSRIVFIGMALSLYSDADRELFRQLAQDPSTALLIIQQQADPFGSDREVQSLLDQAQDCRCVAVAGDDHLYNDIPELGAIIADWLHEGHHKTL